MRFSRSYKWVILGLLFFASVINYVDRQSLSILATTIQAKLSINDLQYSTIVQGFLFAYMLAFLGAGWVTDRLGIRISMTLFIAWWSICNLLTGFANSFRTLAAARFGLGAGEAGLYTVAPKVVGELFPPAQRGLAVGIYTAGATIGASIAPPLIAYLGVTYGWRGAFVATGAVGLLWVVPWLLLYRSTVPASTSMVAEGSKEQWNWREVFTCREALLLLLARTLTDPVWHFMLFWFPKYMMDKHGMPLTSFGKVGWVVYVAADIGCLAGGLISGLFIRRGMPAPDARKWTMTAIAVLIPCNALIPFAGSNAAIFALASIIALAHMTWVVTLTTLAVDIFPARRLGTIFGLIAAGSGLGGMLFTNIVGHLVTHFSYLPVFLIMGCMHPVAVLLIWHVVACVRRRPTATPPEVSEAVV